MAFTVFSPQNGCWSFLIQNVRSAMDTIEMMRKGYEDFAAGNIDAVLSLFTPDIKWHASKGFPQYTDKEIYEYAKMLPETDTAYLEYLKFKETFGEESNVFAVAFKDSTLFGYFSEFSLNI